jgi:hypothetical protein
LQESSIQFDHRQYLIEIKAALDASRTWIENSNPDSTKEEQLQDLEKVAAAVTTELSGKPTSPDAHSRRLNRLLDEVSDVRETRKVRPYELFLFAHQYGVLREELTVKRSTLKPEVRPGPEWPYHFSILSEHGG